MHRFQGQISNSFHANANFDQIRHITSSDKYLWNNQFAVIWTFQQSLSLITESTQLS